MCTFNHENQEKLFLYVEALRGRDDALTQEERKEIAAHVEECEQCREEIKEMQDSMGFLQNLPMPIMPDSLPTRVLENMPSAKKTTIRWMFRLRTLATGAMVLFVVFLSGLWVGQQFQPAPQSLNPDETFTALVAAQNELLDQLETILEEKAERSLVATPEVWRYPMEQVRYSSEMIQKYYEQNQGDPVTQRGFCRAIYQNIETLESLCQALKEEKQPTPDNGEGSNSHGYSL